MAEVLEVATSSNEIPPEVLPAYEKLTTKQKAFIDCYIVDRNGTKSAISAGYSVKSAYIEANRMLKRPHVKKVIDELLYAKAKQHRISLLSKDDFVSRALNDYEKLDIEAANRPRFLELAGRGAGILGSEKQNSGNVTNNTLIINADISQNSSPELWEQTRKLLGA